MQLSWKYGIILFANLVHFHWPSHIYGMFLVLNSIHADLSIIIIIGKHMTS